MDIIQELPMIEFSPLCKLHMILNNYSIESLQLYLAEIDCLDMSKIINTIVKQNKPQFLDDLLAITEYDINNYRFDGYAYELNKQIISIFIKYGYDVNKDSGGIVSMILSSRHSSLSIYLLKNGLDIDPEKYRQLHREIIRHRDYKSFCKLINFGIYPYPEYFHNIKNIYQTSDIIPFFQYAIDNNILEYINFAAIITVDCTAKNFELTEIANREIDFKYYIDNSPILKMNGAEKILNRIRKFNLDESTTNFIALNKIYIDENRHICE